VGQFFDAFPSWVMQILSWVSTPHPAHLLWDFLFVSCTVGAPFRAIMGFNPNSKLKVGDYCDLCKKFVE
jgi:hypothetical protein